MVGLVKKGGKMAGSIPDNVDLTVKEARFLEGQAENATGEALQRLRECDEVGGVSVLVFDGDRLDSFCLSPGSRVYVQRGTDGAVLVVPS